MYGHHAAGETYSQSATMPIQIGRFSLPRPTKTLMFGAPCLPNQHKLAKTPIRKLEELCEYFIFAYMSLVWIGLVFKLQVAKGVHLETRTLLMT
jgi:hypothetical protein